MQKILRICAFIAIVLLMPLMIFAQELGGIRGVVSDQSGAVMPGVKLRATNVATNISVSATSKADGSYEFLQIHAPTTYRVTASRSGFKTAEVNDIPLHLNQIYVLNITMELGAITQVVTVEATPVQVEKTSMQLGATLTGTQIVDLPLNGRNWVQLQQTLPGVVAAADARGNYATNGSQPDQNSYLVNGIDSNDLPLNTPLVIPSPDAIAEVRMVTNTINPEYGRNSGAIMNAVTKGGSNRFHGDGFEFFRDTSLDTRNFFQPTSVIFHQNQFGATIGGPVKKDHTFFFFSYQGTRNRSPQAGGTTTVFTQDQRNGSFPDIAASAVPSPYAMTGEDGTVYPAGTPYSTLFPTGTIPSADFNSLSVSLLNKFVPLPNSGTEYDFNPVVTGVTDQYLTRIDENISSKDALWGSWMWQRNPTTDTLPFTGATLPGFPEVDQRHLGNYSLTWNHTFGGGTLNEARFGYTRFNYGAVLPVNVVDPKNVGFTGITTQNPSGSSWPVIGVTGYFTLGFSTNGPQPRLDQTYQVDDNFTKIMGRHTFKMGFDMRRFQVYNPFANALDGSYTYGGTGVYSTGDPGADFLLGIPDT
ncbi:MAG: carboxypeptidase-like regulatory domain-containing protein, partial [Terriglobia bacterium]